MTSKRIKSLKPGKTSLKASVVKPVRLRPVPITRQKKNNNQGNPPASSGGNSQTPPINPARVEYFKDIVATIHEPLVVLDADLRVLSANRSFYKFFKVTQKETIGNLVYDLGNRQWDIPALRTQLETILPEKAVFNDYLVEHNFPFIGRRIMLLNARRIPAPPKESMWILVAFEDVTEKMLLEQALQASENRFRTAFETAQDSLLLVDKTSGRVLNSNEAAQISFAHSKQKLVNRSLWELDILDDQDHFNQVSASLGQLGFVEIPDRTIHTRQGGNFPANIILMDRAAVIQVNIRDNTRQKKAVQALHSSQEYLAHLLEVVPSGITMVDRSGGITFANRAAEKILGLSRSDISGRLYNDPTWKIVAVDGGEFPDEQLPFVRVMQTGQPVQDIQHAIQHSDGRRVMLSINADPLHDAQGAITGMVAAITDITTQYHSDQALRESEEKWRSLVGCSPDFIALHDSEGRFLFLNHYAKGYSEKDVIGTSVYDYQSPESVDQFRRHFQQALATGAVQHFEHAALGDTGVSRIYDEYLIPLPSKDETINVMAIARDITERKQAEKLLHDNEQRFSTIFHSNPAAIAITRMLDGKLVDVNQSWLTLTGFRLEEVIGHTPLELNLWVDPAQRKHLVQSTQEQGKRDDVVQVRRKSGEVRDLLMEAEILELSDEKYLLTMAQDITERIRNEEALVESHNTLRSWLNAIQESAFLIDRQGIILACNETAARRLNHSMVEMVGACIYDVIPAKVAQSRREQLTRAIESGEPMRFEDQRLGRTIDNLIYPVLDSAGQVKNLAILGADITERKQLEQILREDEQRLASIYATVGDVLFYLDVEPNGQYRFNSVNPAFLQVTGLSSDQVIGRLVSEVIPEPSLSLVLEKYRQAIQARGIIRWEETSDYPSGRLIGEVSVAPVFDPSGTATHLVGSVHDITERKQAEETLRESQALLFNSFNKSPLLMTISDLSTGKYLEVNDSFCKTSEFTREEALGRTSIEIGWISEETRTRMVDELQQQGRVTGLELALRSKSGKMIICRYSGEVIQTAEGNILFSTAEDITERKQAEQELLETSERLTHMIASSPTVIYALRADENPPVPFWISENIRSILGFNPEDPQQPGWWLEHVHAQDRPQVQESLEHLFDDDFHQEYRFQHKDGRLIWLYDIHRLLRDADNKPWEIIGAWTDITRIKQAEQALQEYNQRLEAEVSSRTRELREAQEKLVRQEKLAVLGQLAGGVGHELRNPLSVINTCIYYLRLVQPEASEKVKEHHAMIEQEVHTADKIISDLLDFGRVTTADRESFSVPELVQRVLERYPVPASIKLTLRLPASLPPAYADPHQVEQVLGNLTVNACQAMVEGGKLTIRGDCFPEMHRDDVVGKSTLLPREHRDDVAMTEDGEHPLPERASRRCRNDHRQQWVRIAVKDTGTGITPENMAKLFEPLFTTKLKGIGLGLAVSKKLAEANGGRIEVTSEPGKGSTFTLYLPLKG